MYVHYRALRENSKVRAYFSLAFFVCMYILFNMLLLNLFLAILLETYGQVPQVEEELDDENKEDIGAMYICCKMG